MEIIQRSGSAWASPLHMVKASGGWQPCRQPLSARTPRSSSSTVLTPATTRPCAQPCQMPVRSNSFGFSWTPRHATRPPLPAKVATITKFPPPSSVKELQEFIGMLNFYHHFVLHVAQFLQPLYRTLTGKPADFQWTAGMSTAFVKSKMALVNATMLTYLQPNAPLAVTVHVSATAVGAVVEQLVNVWQPLAFFSRQLRPPEQKYSAFDCKLLALYLAVRYFPTSLKEGSSPPSRIISHSLSLLQRWLIRGQPASNVISLLSRNTLRMSNTSLEKTTLWPTRCRGSSSTPSRRASTMPPYQRRKRKTPSWQLFAQLVLEDVVFGPTGTMILCDVSTGQPQPLVPTVFRRQVSDALHNLAHPSIRATQNLLMAKFVWRGIRKQVGFWARTCIPCRAAKVHRHTKAPLHTFAVPHRRFQHLNVNIVGPRLLSRGYKYLFTIVDRFAR